jgi:alkanesulfonate monooxygenase SsuD/methylene tetrahydromethanopterin reductase-like flavin-dependent oxidoreductase (luciferase family)
MTWVYVGETPADVRARVERARRLDATAGSLDAYLDELERDCIVGTPDRAAERLSEYAAAGVERFFLNHQLYDDDEMLELLASDIVPKVEA